MQARRARQTTLFATLLLVGTASAAALFAHVGIDAAGDVLLAHDSYDGLDHGSRSDVLAVVFVLALGALLRVLWVALDEARTGRAARRPTFNTLVGSGCLRYVCAVAALTVPALMAMELADLVAAGGRLDDVTDLLGGSVWLGLGITLPVGAAVALGVRSIAAMVLRSHRVLVAVFGRFLSGRRARCVHPTDDARTFSRDRQLRGRSVLSRRSGKRGPPLFAS